MPCDEINATITKLATEVNYPFDFETQDLPLSEILKQEYEKCKENEDLAIFWQFQYSVLCEKEIYRAPLTKIKSGNYKVEAKYLLLYRKNHQDEWSQLPSGTQDYLVNCLSTISGYVQPFHPVQ